MPGSKEQFVLAKTIFFALFNTIDKYFANFQTPTGQELEQLEKGSDPINLKLLPMPD
jgi:hypothetical protein